MPRFSSRHSKQPQDKEAMKPPKQQQPKKSLSAEMGDRIKTIAEARLEKQQAENRQRFKQQEDDQMAMCYGPNWRHQYPGQEQEAPKHSAPTPKTDEFDSEYYDDPRKRKAS